MPLPAAYALYGLTSGRVLGIAQRLGLFKKLLDGPATAGRLAEELELQVAGTRLLCENLGGLGILDQDGHTFSLPKRSRKWLDPASDTCIGTWLEHTEWYADLERIVRDGGSFEIHREPAEDEAYWRLYITGQYEIARLSAQEVAKAIRLPSQPSALLDVAGAHGWSSAELCRRHEALKATVVDLPGSARVGAWRALALGGGPSLSRRLVRQDAGEQRRNVGDRVGHRRRRHFRRQRVLAVLSRAHEDPG